MPYCREGHGGYGWKEDLQVFLTGEEIMLEEMKADLGGNHEGMLTEALCLRGKADASCSKFKL